ncbi:MAG: Crp/Fnr family transcriptional regulator [Planctomycetota bacterium]|nr:Crp/Fnr family transcriptional regulator [Planctomycetota bacterium]
MSRLNPTQVSTALRQVPLFSSLDKEALSALVRACPSRGLAVGEQVFAPAQPAESFYAILAGKVKVYMISPKGDEQILHLYGPGQTFGEAAMWAGGRYPAYAEAVDPATLLVVSRAVLKGLIAKNADLALAMLAGLSSKLREFSSLIEQLSLKDVPARLAAALLTMPAKAGSDVVELKGTKRQLASQIGTIPETLSRALKKLADSGLIEVEGSTIRILDADGLGEVAER